MMSSYRWLHQNHHYLTSIVTRICSNCSEHWLHWMYLCEEVTQIHSINHHSLCYSVLIFDLSSLCRRRILIRWYLKCKKKKMKLIRIVIDLFNDNFLVSQTAHNTGSMKSKDIQILWATHREKNREKQTFITVIASKMSWNIWQTGWLCVLQRCRRSWFFTTDAICVCWCAVSMLSAPVAIFGFTECDRIFWRSHTFGMWCWVYFWTMRRANNAFTSDCTSFAYII